MANKPKTKSNLFRRQQESQKQDLFGLAMSLAGKHEVDTASHMKFCPYCGHNEVEVKSLPAGMASVACNNCKRSAAVRLLK